MLVIFVEGEDDKNFFEKIVTPKLEYKYEVRIFEYARRKKEKISDFIRSIKSMNGDYIYVSDFDSGPCISAKKEKKCGEYKNIEKDKIIIVKQEIESCYLAGLNDANSKKFKIKKVPDVTDTVTKEKFYELTIKERDLNFMLKILNNFDIETAKQKNKSFKYFVTKYKINT